NQLGNSYNSQNQLGNSYTNQNQLGNSYNNQNQSGHFPMDGPSSPSRGFGVNENYFSSRDFKDGEDKAQADNCGTECKPQRTSGKVSNTSSCDGSTSDRCLNMGGLKGGEAGGRERPINPVHALNARICAVPSVHPAAAAMFQQFTKLKFFQLREG
ncbi:unnamed protein product, partial [Allacma fusca]